MKDARIRTLLFMIILFTGLMFPLNFANAQQPPPAGSIDIG